MNKRTEKEEDQSKKKNKLKAPGNIYMKKLKRITRENNNDKKKVCWNGIIL